MVAMGFRSTEVGSSQEYVPSSRNSKVSLLKTILMIPKYHLFKYLKKMETKKKNKKKMTGIIYYYE